jgi:hypothetical protein
MAGVLTLIMIGAISVLVMPAIRNAWLRFSAFDHFLKVVHTQQPPTAYDGVYQLVQQHFGQTCAWLVGLFALIPIALGALALAWPVGMIFAIRRTGWRPLDSFPVWLSGNLARFGGPRTDCLDWKHFGVPAPALRPSLFCNVNMDPPLCGPTLGWYPTRRNLLAPTSPTSDRSVATGYPICLDVDKRPGRATVRMG